MNESMNMWEDCDVVCCTIKFVSVEFKPGLICTVSPSAILMSFLCFPLEIARTVPSAPIVEEQIYLQSRRWSNAVLFGAEDSTASCWARCEAMCLHTGLATGARCVVFCCTEELIFSRRQGLLALQDLTRSDGDDRRGQPVCLSDEHLEQRFVAFTLFQDDRHATLLCNTAIRPTLSAPSPETPFLVPCCS